ncbi:MAG: hypothetical protein IJW14_01230 [Oscillospiraceae bacterium]|nr:hypothetical protein [Oscillospiraceae bacterium]
MKKLSKIFAVVLCLAMVLSVLPVGVSAATEKYVEFTVDSLGLGDQSYSAGTTTVDGVGVEWIQLGNYGDGIQMRDSEKNGEWRTSMFWNTSALGSGITKIELTYSDSKDVTYANADCEIFNFGNEAKGDAYSTKLSTTAGTKTYTITPDADTYTYFYMEHDLKYTFYWKSIKVYYNDNGSNGGSTPAPETPAPETPAGVSIADGEYVIVCPAYNKALSSSKALNEDGSASFYNAGVDVTVSGSTVSGHGDAEKWIVTNNEDGTITISQNGQNLALADKFSSMNLGEVNDKWVLEDAGNGLYYVKNSARGNYIEWYDSYSNWSTYGTINDEALFALQFVGLNVQQPSEPSGPSEPNAGTGDLSVAGLVVVMMAATAGVVVLAKKKEF